MFVLDDDHGGGEGLIAHSLDGDGVHAGGQRFEDKAAVLIAGAGAVEEREMDFGVLQGFLIWVGDGAFEGGFAAAELHGFAAQFVLSHPFGMGAFEDEYLQV